MKLKINNNEYWIKDVDLPSNFDSMNDYDKEDYIYENGPAVITSEGIEIWFLNGLCHRIDGPAYISPYEYKTWYLNNIEVKSEIYKKIQNSSKEELLVYMIDSKYKDYLSLIEFILLKRTERYRLKLFNLDSSYRLKDLLTESELPFKLVKNE